MKLLPYENFHIITLLKPAKVQGCLEREVEPDAGFSFKGVFSSPSAVYFSGYVVNGTFEFKRIINYRNSFLPRIKGSTESWISGGRVHVKMKMHIAVTIFMCIWLSFALFGGIEILLQELKEGQFVIADLV